MKYTTVRLLLFFSFRRGACPRIPPRCSFLGFPEPAKPSLDLITSTNLDNEYDFLEIFRSDKEYEFDYEYDFLETLRFDYEYDFSDL